MPADTPILNTNGTLGMSIGGTNLPGDRLPAGGILFPEAAPASSALVQVISLRGDDTKAAPIAVTLSTFRQRITDQALSSPIAARLRWGTKGIFHEADIDVGLGTVFTLFGSALDVSVMNEAFQVADIQPNAVKASAAYGAVTGRPNHLYRSFDFGGAGNTIFPVIDAGLQRDFPVPPFATGVAIQSVNTILFNYTIVVLGNGADPTMIVPPSPALGDIPPTHVPFFPLTGYARLIRLVNNSANNGMAGKVVFTIGI